MINCLIFFQKRQLYQNVYWIELMRHWTRWERTEDKKKETRSTGGRTNRKNWKRSLVLSFAAVMAFGATVFAAEKYMGISSFFSNGGARLSKEGPGSD